MEDFILVTPTPYSTFSPMDISPIASKPSLDSSMEPDTKNETTPIPPKVTEKADDETKISKKRKAAEVEQDWEELGEPIQKNKSLAVKRIESRSEKFIQGLCINLDWCNACKYSDLLEILEAQGWVNLFSVCFDNVLAYAPLKEFCSNFNYEDGVCTSKVKNKFISFDANLLSEAFGVPNEGFDSYFKGSTDMEVEGVSIDVTVESIGGKANVVKTNHNNFTPLQQLLLHFVWQAIVPRSQHRNEANHLDAILMYCFENKIKINFPSLMIQHLNHCIKHDLMIGYGNLLMTLLESFEIPLAKYEHLKLQTNHYIQPRTLESWNLRVVDSKTQFIEKKGRAKKVEVIEEESEENEVVEVKGEAEEEVESKMKKKGNGKGRHGTKRKSMRLAAKPTEKVAFPTFPTLGDDDEGKEESKGTSGFIKSPGFGFGGFSSSSISEELQEIKAILMKNEGTQGTVLARLEAVESMVTSLAATSNILTKELKDSIASLAQGQKELKERLEEMVLESKSDEEVAE